MAKYKGLQSVAHNTGHSFVSAMHWFDGAYGIEHLRAAARAAGVSRVHINLLRGVLEPPSLRTPTVLQVAGIARDTFERLLKGEGWAPEQLRAADLYVELPNRSCRVEVVDDRGRRHVGDVQQWGV